MLELSGLEGHGPATPREPGVVYDPLLRRVATDGLTEQQLTRFIEIAKQCYHGIRDLDLALGDVELVRVMKECSLAAPITYLRPQDVALTGQIPVLEAMIKQFEDQGSPANAQGLEQAKTLLATAKRTDLIMKSSHSAPDMGMVKGMDLSCSRSNILTKMTATKLECVHRGVLRQSFAAATLDLVGLVNQEFGIDIKKADIEEMNNWNENDMVPSLRKNGAVARAHARMTQVTVSGAAT